jgi:hypothetical protein
MKDIRRSGIRGRKWKQWWIRLSKGKDIGASKNSTRPHWPEKLLQKTLWTCCKTDYIMKYVSV